MQETSPAQLCCEDASVKNEIHLVTESNNILPMPMKANANTYSLDGDWPKCHKLHEGTWLPDGDDNLSSLSSWLQLWTRWKKESWIILKPLGKSTSNLSVFCDYHPNIWEVCMEQGKTITVPTEVPGLQVNSCSVPFTKGIWLNPDLVLLLPNGVARVSP